MPIKTIIASISLVSLATLSAGCAVVPDRHGGERVVVSPVAAALTVGAIAVASQPVYVAPQPVYAQPVPVYQAPAPQVQPQPVYPQADLETLLVAAAVADIVLMNGDTYVWHLDRFGRREAVFAGHGDRRGELMARGERREDEHR